MYIDFRRYGHIYTNTQQCSCEEASNYWGSRGIEISLPRHILVNTKLSTDKIPGAEHVCERARHKANRMPLRTFAASIHIRAQAKNEAPSLPMLLLTPKTPCLTIVGFSKRTEPLMRIAKKAISLEVGSTLKWGVLWVCVLHWDFEVALINTGSQHEYKHGLFVFIWQHG